MSRKFLRPYGNVTDNNRHLPPTGIRPEGHKGYEPFSPTHFVARVCHSHPIDAFEKDTSPSRPAPPQGSDATGPAPSMKGRLFATLYLNSCLMPAALVTGFTVMKPVTKAAELKK